ncbi:hypothetical protein BH23CHL3_BH23CHL3_06390 [soil metagenome]
MPLRSAHRPILLVAVAALLLVVAVVLAWPGTGLADHESTNDLTFAPVEDSPSPDGAGHGIIDYHGGGEPDTLWTATFQFTDLEPEQAYAVMVQGRFGLDGTDAATAFTPICEFTTDASGDGGCWYYFVGLRRLAVMEVRIGDADGEVVLRATVNDDGPGSLSRMANEFSPTATALAAQSASASPAATPGAIPVASPGATPADE